MNAGAICIIGLLILSLMGIPICFSIGLGSLLALVMATDLPTIIIPQRLFTGIDSTALLAIPFFVLAGNLMGQGITDKILKFSNAMIGQKKGSLGIVTVVASAIFAAISGSGVATVSAIGGITIPAMKDEGYPAPFATSIAAISSTLGPLIPPSIFLIVYGNATETSVGQLFGAAAIPGVLFAITLAIYAYFYAKKRNFPTRPAVSRKEKLKITIDSIWALLLPVIILVGIFGGIFTATEAAAVSALYSFIVAMFIYRSMKWKDLIPVLASSAITSAALLMLTGLSNASSWIVATSGLPNIVVEAIRATISSPAVLLLMLNLMLLVVGMIMEANAAIVMLVPLILPLLNAFGISKVTFGVVMAFNLCLGLVTPPVGACVLLATDIGKTRLGATMKVIMLPLLIGIAVLLLTTYIPPLTLLIPELMRSAG